MPFKDDFKFGKDLIHSSPKQDKELGIDAWIGKIPVAWRKRRISFFDYKQVSIRYERDSGAKTEIDKILDGTFIPKIYFFPFLDVLVICYTNDIKKCLQNKQYEIHKNDDGTWGCYIHIKNITNYILVTEPRRTNCDGFTERKDANTTLG